METFVMRQIAKEQFSYDKYGTDSLAPDAECPALIVGDRGCYEYIIGLVGKYTGSEDLSREADIAVLNFLDPRIDMPGRANNVHYARKLLYAAHSTKTYENADAGGDDNIRFAKELLKLEYLDIGVKADVADEYIAEDEEATLNAVANKKMLVGFGRKDNFLSERMFIPDGALPNIKQYAIKKGWHDEAQMLAPFAFTPEGYAELVQLLADRSGKPRLVDEANNYAKGDGIKALLYAALATQTDADAENSASNVNFAQWILTEHNRQNDRNLRGHKGWHVVNQECRKIENAIASTRMIEGMSGSAL